MKGPSARIQFVICANERFAKNLVSFFLLRTSGLGVNFWTFSEAISQFCPDLVLEALCFVLIGVSCIFALFVIKSNKKFTSFS